MRIEETAARLWSDLRSLWGARPLKGARRQAARRPAAHGAPDTDVLRTTLALAPFLDALADRRAPVLLDLGPVVQSNLTFFSERFDCRVRVEDLQAVVDQHVREGTLQDLPEFFSRCFTQATGSVDGIVCWDVFDYLDREAARALAGELTRLLRRGGVLLGFFAGRPGLGRRYTRFSIVDAGHLHLRPYPAACHGRTIRVDRDILHLFDTLHVSAAFLLKTGTREMLFHKRR